MQGLSEGREEAGLGNTRALKLASAVIVLLAVVYAAASIYVADRSLVAEATPLSARPADWGLEAEAVAFAPRGEPELQLRGWWLPAAAPRATVIRVHGLDSNRSSLLGLSAALVEAGYSVLVFDLRGHGQSDPAPMGAGLDERDDVLGAVDYVLERQDHGSGTLFLHGNSYGGAIALLAGWRDNRVSGVFADSAFASLSSLVAQEVSRRTGLPEWAARALRPGVTLAGRLLHGVDIGAVNPAAAAARYDYPLGLAHCRPDERIPVAHFHELRAQLRHEPMAQLFEDCPHSDAWPAHPRRYEALVRGYFETRLKAAHRGTASEAIPAHQTS